MGVVMSFDFNCITIQAVQKAIHRAVQEPKPERAIRRLLETLGESLQASNIFLFKIANHKEELTYEWKSVGSSSLRHDIRELFNENGLVDWTNSLYENQKILIRDIAEIKGEEESLITSFEALGISRFAILPIFRNKTFGGVLGIVNPIPQTLEQNEIAFDIISDFLSQLLERREYQKRENRLSKEDPVTGVQTMDFLIRQMERRRIAKLSTGGPLRFKAIVYCNIVQFTNFNDIFGYDEGNKCLKAIADTLKSVFHSDKIARYGADRFILFAEDPNVIEQVRTAHDLIYNMVSEHSLWLEAGIYYINPSLQDTVSTMTDYAKTACNEIKNHGADISNIYTEKLNRELIIHKYVQDHIDEAIHNHYINVFLQPVVRTLTGELCNAEALSRWLDPVYGEIAPAVFIPALEEKNLSWKLDRYVMEVLAGLVRELRERKINFVPISINLSRKDFDLWNPFETLEDLIRENDIPRSSFCIEITESTVMSDPARFHREIDNFHRAGYEVWMDDFGSGYSSLNTLKDFDFDELKIDMLFVRNLNQKARDLLIHIVDMAKDLGIRTLCEGVENQEQFDFLREIGCEKIQGYYFGKPQHCEIVTSDAFLEKLPAESKEEMYLYNHCRGLHFNREIPFGMALFDGVRVRISYVNQMGQSFIKEEGDDGIDVLEQHVNDPGNAFHEKFFALMNQPMDEGSARSLYFTRQYHYFRLQVTLVGRIHDKKLFAVYITDQTQEELRNDSVISDDSLRMIFNAFYWIYKVDYTDARITPLASITKDEVLGQEVLLDPQARLATIYWKDQERYSHLLDPDYVRKELERSDHGSFTEIFRRSVGETGYRWIATTVIRIPVQDKLVCLILSKPSAYSDPVKAKFLAETILSSNHVGQTDRLPGSKDIGEDELMDALLAAPSVKLSWKDRNRRFVGVSRGFLQFNGLTSAESLIGKRDEEINWSMDFSASKREEEEVLKGHAMPFVYAQRIVDGKLYPYLYSKLPIFRDGKVTGLLCIILSDLDLTSREREPLDLAKNSELMISWIRTNADFEKNYRDSSENYTMAVIVANHYWLLYRSLGGQAADQMMENAERILRRELGRDNILIRLTNDKFILLSKKSTQVLSEELQGTLAAFSEEESGQKLMAALSYGLASRNEVNSSDALYSLVCQRAEGLLQRRTEIPLNDRDYLDIATDITTPYIYFRAILNDNMDQIVDMQILFANDAYGRMVNRRPDQLIGRSYFEAVPKADPTWLTYFYQAAVLRKEVRDCICSTDLSKTYVFHMSPGRMPLCCSWNGFELSEEEQDNDLAKRNWATDDRIIRIARLINQNTEYEELIPQILQEIGFMLNADRVQLIDFSAEQGEIQESMNRFEWCREGVSGTEDTNKNRLREICMAATRLTAQNPNGISYQSLKPERNLRELVQYFDRYSLDHLYCLPIVDHNKIIGYLAVQNYSLAGDINLQKFMQMTAVFLSKKLTNHYIMGRLDFLSYHDRLTGALNSHAYYERLAELQKGNESIGVIFVDMNGLKWLNDHVGHESGDSRLQEVADLLIRLYHKENVYRIGGDEFLVLLSDVDENEFRIQVSRLGDYMSEDTTTHTSLAVGCSWSRDAKSLREVVHLADKDMYANKAKYYASHDRRRR